MNPWSKAYTIYLPLFRLVAFILIVMFILAICAPWLSAHDPRSHLHIDFGDVLLAPFSAGHLLGTDDMGRDVASMLLYGLRTSLIVGFISCVLALVIGLFLGILAAFYRGAGDQFLSRLIDLQLSFPTLLLALVFVAVFGQGKLPLIFAIVAGQWAYFARTARSAASQEMHKEYIEAAFCLPHSVFYIIGKHLLPNCLPPLLVVFSYQFAHAIGMEAALSFLGVGLPHSEASLGLMIANGFEHFLGNAYWISLFPGLLLIMLVSAVTIFGDQLSRYLNPRNYA
jgi:peptide/nickel transport system permease protein